MSDIMRIVRHLSTIIQLRKGGRKGTRLEVLPKRLIKTSQYDYDDSCSAFDFKLEKQCDVEML